MVDVSSYRACAICHKADIPRAVRWLWWQSGRPIHPWCDSMWAMFSQQTKVQIELMVRRVVAGEGPA